MFLGYARVSTEDQKLDLQLQALTSAGCERIFEDKISGSKFQRPGLDQAISFARKGDVIVVWRLDRLGRSLRDLIKVVGELEEADIGFRSLTEGLDTSSPGGTFLFHLFGAIAEFEKAIIRDRTRAGLVAAKKNGKKFGRPSSLSKTDLRIAKALLLNDDLSIKEICGRLKISVPTLYRYFPGGRAGLEP